MTKVNLLTFSQVCTLVSSVSNKILLGCNKIFENRSISYNKFNFKNNIFSKVKIKLYFLTRESIFSHLSKHVPTFSSIISPLFLSRTNLLTPTFFSNTKNSNKNSPQQSKLHLISRSKFQEDLQQRLYRREKPSLTFTQKPTSSHLLKHTHLPHSSTFSPNHRTKHNLPRCPLSTSSQVPHTAMYI